jgi:parallel beta-helix repeat protein
MTKTAVVSRSAYVADGLATPRNIGFPLQSAADLIVKVNGALQALNTHYTITGPLSNPVMTPLSPFWANGATVRYKRKTPASQQYDAQAGAALSAEGLEATLDRNVMAIQDIEGEQADLTARAVSVDEGATAPSLDIAGLIEGDILEYRGGKFRRFLREAFAGKFFAGDATGKMVPASGIGVDSALRTDIAASGGSGLMGFLQAGTGAVAETMQTAMRRMPVTLEQFGGGTGVANNYTAMVAAFRTGRPIMLGAGEYTFSTAIDFGVLNTGGSAFTAPNITIFGDGMDRTTLKYTGAGTGLKGGRTAPASNGYGQTLHLFDLTYSGNGTGSTALGTVNNPAITYGNFTTIPGTGFSGSNSTQYGIEWEMEGGCVIERCRLTKFYTPIRTKLGYGATIRNNHITGNQIGIEVGQAVTTLSITGNIIERNAIGITLWICGGIMIENNAIQGNYAGCDIYSFILNRSVSVLNNYFEVSPKCFVQNGSNANLSFRCSNFRFEGNYALEVDIVEFASGFVFSRNSMKSFAVATANISDIIVENNRDHANDNLSRFVNYTGTGAANIIKNDAPLIYSQVYDVTSLANGAVDTVNVTVTGAVVGDFAQASLSTMQAGLNIIATVISANNVRIEIENKSGGTVDLASGTLRVRVFKA